MSAGWTSEARARIGVLNLVAHPFPHVTAQWIAERVARGQSDNEMAFEAGCSSTTIAKRRKRAGISPATPAGTRKCRYGRRPLGNDDGRVKLAGVWPDLPADAFRDVRIRRHHGGRVSGGIAETRGLGEWML